MDDGYVRFPIGELRGVAVSDGAFNYPIESFFANAPRAEVENELRRRGLPTNRVTTPYTCLYIDTGEHRVLVDTGAGKIGAAAPKMFPGIDHTTTVTGLLADNLAAAGVDPSTIDTVIVTHAHPDHIGGTLRDDGSLVYANARYVIGREEWAFWSSDRATELAPPPFVQIARANLDPVRDRMRLVDDGEEIVPGIRAVAAPGHTPGHIALAIESGDATLLHVSDTVLHPLHLEQPEWTPAFDLLPAEAAASKRRIFDRAADEGWLVFGHHFPPFPNLGHVRRLGRGWLWEPQVPIAPS